jgi:predicted cupin superfamily sugar epimerase
MMMMNPEDIISALQLKPHPEGGWYHETYRAEAAGIGRATSTAIYYLLKAGERSHWHRVTDADEIWNWHAGSALRLSISSDGQTEISITLGADLARGEQPQAVVHQRAWQAAEPIDGWCLVSCIVAPGFEFDGFEMAPDGWSPGDD